MLAPAEICDEVVNVGIKKGKWHTLQTSILGILAGAFIALGGFAASMASHSIENVGVAKLAAGLVFPMGLMLVLICGGELFTGNSLMSVALAEGKVNLRQMLRNWIIVYFTNFIGAFLIAFLIFQSGLLDTNAGKLGGYAVKVAANKAGLSFWQAFSSGILCNFLVCLAVWGAYGAKDMAGKIAIIWFPIMAFVVSGFEHSVANMYYFSIGMLAKSNPAYVEAAHAGNKIAKLDILHIIQNLIPVTLGNIVGGMVLVGLAYWAVFKKAPAMHSRSLNSNIE
jgi:formate/nitrite transporter